MHYLRLTVGIGRREGGLGLESDNYRIECDSG
jgi:hypothetical protein